VTLAGQDMTYVPPNKRKVGMVFQSYALFPNMTVAENIGYGLKIAGNRELILKGVSMRCLPSFTWKASIHAIQASFRAGSSSAWPWRVPWPSTPRPCFWITLIGIGC